MMDAEEPKRLPLLDAFDAHPVSVAAVAAICDPLIGMIRPFTLHRWRLAWWDALRGASTPEEKLTCERMLDRISVTIGLCEPEKGAAMARQNREIRDQASIAEADAAALERWR